MPKSRMHTPDLVAQNIEWVAARFPGCITESRNERGELVRAVDFDLLRQELSKAIVEGPQERYHLNWPGKRESLLAANAPIAKTLRPCREESVAFDTSRNLFIEGDNLDALRLLREAYANRVKMIYIDPPYNTGKNRLYRDDFAESADDYLLRSQQRDAAGVRLVANGDTNGRYHSDWLTMMFSRLRIAHDLLTDDGILFISIGEHEIHNVRHLCDEIMGRANFLASFVWRTDGNFDNQAKVKSCHEYIVSYCRNAAAFPHPPVIDPGTTEDSKLFNSEIRNTIVKNGPRNPVSRIELPAGFPASFDQGAIAARTDAWPHYESEAVIVSRVLKKPTVVASGWSSKDLLAEFIASGCQPIVDSKGQQTTFEISRSGAVEVVKKRSDSQSHVISVIGGMGGSQKAAAELEELDIAFDDYPKPTQLLQYLISMNRGTEFVVFDFFAGSGTTADAVLRANAKDGGKRRFIACQVAETCEAESRASKQGFSTIAEICKERIRRAGQQLRTDNPIAASAIDTGFRVLKIDSSNMKDVYYRPDEATPELLGGHVDNIKDDRSDEDLLFQVLLDWGVDLSLPIKKETISGKPVYFVDENALAACFAAGIDEALVKALAARKPLRAVFRDSGYGSDDVKINVEQIFKQLSPGTEVKTL